MSRLPVLRLAAVLVCLNGCSHYAFNLNDNRLYTPPTLFVDYHLPDQALADCVEQTITDQKVTEPAQLLRLNCAYAGVRSLQGLEVFAHLQEINLAGNQLQSLEPLNAMNLPVTINLTGNDQLKCIDIEELRRKGANVIVAQECESVPDGTVR